jgi:hypothetical protein
MTLRIAQATEMHAGFFCGNLKERSHFEDLGIDWRIILRWMVKK